MGNDTKINLDAEILALNTAMEKIANSTVAKEIEGVFSQSNGKLNFTVLFEKIQGMIDSTEMTELLEAALQLDVNFFAQFTKENYLEFVASQKKPRSGAG